MKRVRPLPIEPAPVPVQLVLGLEGGVLAVVGKRAKGRRFVPGGTFAGQKVGKAA